MILDWLTNAHSYLPLNPRFAKAFEFLQHSELKGLPEEKYEIDGDNIFALVAKEQGRKKEEALLETHEKYIDIQVVLEGTDDMGWKPKFSCSQPKEGYDSEKDLQFFMDQPDTWLSVKPGSFAIFFPEDAHMPLISSETLHKIVVKIKVD